jgi:predicted PurR-regulated permease PerM
VSRPLSVFVVALTILAVVVMMFSVMVPALITESQDAKDNLPESAREVEELLDDFGIHVELEERARNFEWDDLFSGRAAVDAGQQLLTTTVSIITVVVMTLYLLADTPRMARFLSQFIPENRLDEGERLFQALSRVVGGYLRGQLITSAAIGLFTFIMLSILGVQNPLAFAVFAAVVDVIPLVGALAATIPPTAAALQESSTKALIVVVGMVLYQQFEDRFLVPRVYGRTLNLPPIIVLIAVLAGAELFGIIGVLLALPLTAAARVAVDFMIENRRLPLMPEPGETQVIYGPDGEPLEVATPGPPEDEVPAEGAADARTGARGDQILAPDGTPVPDADLSPNGVRERAQESEPTG